MGFVGFENTELEGMALNGLGKSYTNLSIKLYIIIKV